MLTLELWKSKCERRKRPTIIFFIISVQIIFIIILVIYFIYIFSTHGKEYNVSTISDPNWLISKSKREKARINHSLLKQKNKKIVKANKVSSTSALLLRLGILYYIMFIMLHRSNLWIDKGLIHVKKIIICGKKCKKIIINTKNKIK